MNNNLEGLKSFREKIANQLLTCIKAHSIYNIEDIESVVHALVDISELIEKIYGEIIPDIINHSNLKTEELRDKLWDIREEFRHIEYHLNDAKIIEL